MWFLLLACNSGPPTPNAFDRDADGWLRPVDCDDDNAGVYPGANDVFYDGRDADCMGDNDFDQDGDGYTWDAHGGLDCNDLDPLVNPEGVEVPYDGDDNDCDPATPENDLDGDGFLLSLDCDDDDPDTYPGAPERLGDLVDQDCGGDADSATLLSWSGGLLTRPRALRATTFEGRPVVAFAAERVDTPSNADPRNPDALDPANEPLLQPVLAVLDPLAPEPEWLVAFGSLNDDFTTSDIPSAVDVVGDGDTLWVGVGYATWRTAELRTRLSPFVRLGDAMIRQNGPARTLDGASGSVVQVDVQLAGTGAQLVGASDEQLTAYRGELGEVGEGLGGTVLTTALGGAAVAPDGSLWSCDAMENCTSWVLPADGPPADPLAVSGVSRVLRERDGLLVVRDGPVGARVEGLSTPLVLFPDDVVVDADVTTVERGGTTWVVAAAVVESGADDRVAISYGPTDAGLFTTAFLTGPDAGFPMEVAVWADESEVVVAAITLDFARYDRMWIGAYPWAD